MASEKIADSGETGVMVGYKGRKIYRIYIPPRHTVIETPHVTFFETTLAEANEDEKESPVDNEMSTLRNTSAQDPQCECALSHWETDINPLPTPQLLVDTTVPPDIPQVPDVVAEHADPLAQPQK